MEKIEVNCLTHWYANLFTLSAYVMENVKQ